MKKSIILFLACMLLLPASVVGESKKTDDQLIAETSSGILFGDQQSLYTMDQFGYIHQYYPDQTSASIAIDVEKTYPFVMQGQVYVFNKADENISRLLPQGEEAAISMPITRDLAGGGSDWQLCSMRADDESVYFLFTDIRHDTPFLCRYNIEQNLFEKTQIDQLSEYMILAQGETLAISRTVEKTIVYSVDWSGNKHQELYSLGGQYAGFASDGANLYAADLIGLCFVLLRDGKEQMRVQSPYAAGVLAGTFTQGAYYALGSTGLYRPDFSTQQEEAGVVLRVMEWYADGIDIAFMKAYPDVRLEYISSTAYEGMDFSQALITGLISYDIARISNVTPAAKSLIGKGYAYDLAQNPELLALAKTMYKPIQDLIFQNGQLVLMPNYIDFRGIGEYNENNLLAAGLSPVDLPKTLEKSMDFVIAWRNEHGEPESLDDIVPVVDLVGYPKQVYLLQVMDTYIAHYRRAGQDLDFDTQEFRTLLVKAMEAAESTPNQTEFSSYRGIWAPFGGMRVPSTNSIVFPLREDEDTRYTGAISGYIIDPRSQNKEMAFAYIQWRSKAMDELNKRLLFEGQHSALERPDYPNTLERLIENKAALESALLSEGSDVEKRILQKQIDALNDRINNPSDTDRYLMTNDMISFYQQEIIPNIEFPFSDPVTELSSENVETWRMIKRYLDGEMDMERFVMELNQRERLRRMENM